MDKFLYGMSLGMLLGSCAATLIGVLMIRRRGGY